MDSNAVSNVRFIVLLCCLSTQQAWSTFNRFDKINFYVKQPMGGCVDRFSTEECERYEHLCSRKPALRNKFCKRTCGECPAISPLPCEATTFGCCWDRLTRKSDLHGSNCPVCKDRIPNCPNLRRKCSRYSHVRRYCPVTCAGDDICKNTSPCMDDPLQKPWCPIFKEDGFCELDPELMRVHCKKTCGLCSESETNRVNKANGVTNNNRYGTNHHQQRRSGAFKWHDAPAYNGDIEALKREILREETGNSGNDADVPTTNIENNEQNDGIKSDILLEETNQVPAKNDADTTETSDVDANKRSDVGVEEASSDAMKLASQVEAEKALIALEEDELRRQAESKREDISTKTEINRMRETKDIDEDQPTHKFDRNDGNAKAEYEENVEMEVDLESKRDSSKEAKSIPKEKNGEQKYSSRESVGKVLDDKANKNEQKRDMETKRRALIAVINSLSDKELDEKKQEIMADLIGMYPAK